jgi:DNA-binding winged helix-turn-helix (wHTH) protein/tetratricopeptide (TPR) repeat protein
VPPADHDRLVRFSVFELDLEVRELRRRGRFVPLPPQPFVLLALLVQRPGEVVTREELRRALWGDGVHVDHERGLNYAVNRLRRTLGDSAQSPRFIETVPRLGYRFLASVDKAPRFEAPERPDAGTAVSRRPWLPLAAALVLAMQGAGMARHSRAGQPGLPSLDRAAQQAFETGRRWLDQGSTGWRKSIGFFADAARRDTGFALARYGLADAYMRLGENGVLASDEAFPAARAAALQALAIEDRAEPLAILAALRLNYDWDWPGAEATYRHALALDPDLLDARVGYGRLLSAAGRHAEALRVLGAAEARQPACAEIVRDVGFTFYRARQFPAAAQRFKDWAELRPAAVDPHHWLALLHLQKGELAEAKREARIVMALAGAGSEALHRFDAAPPRLAMDRYLRGCLDFLARLAETRSVAEDDVARLHALLGDREGALAALRRAAEQRSPSLLPSLAEPSFDSLRSDPLFQELAGRVRSLLDDRSFEPALTVAALLP